MGKGEICADGHHGGANSDGQGFSDGEGSSDECGGVHNLRQEL